VDTSYPQLFFNSNNSKALIYDMITEKRW
jgi:hypothetical protein